MARYRAKAKLWVRVTGAAGTRAVEPGEEFSSDDVPGRNWFPLDEEARAAWRARFHAEPSEEAQSFGVGGGNSPWRASPFRPHGSP